MKLSAGDTFARYLVKRQLGAGGMAEVYAVAKLGPGARSNFVKLFALKRILTHHASDPSFVARFLEEMRLAAQLEHPNVVSVVDYGVDEPSGDYFIVLELVRGLDLRSLAKELARQARTPDAPTPYPGQERGQLPPDVVAHIGMAAAEVLAYAHRSELRHGERRDGVIHRDLSPDNLMADVAGYVKVNDWGIAKSYKTEVGAASRTKHAVGKLAYMPPEQLAGEAIDPRADLYALGIVLFRLLTGSHPYADPSRPNEDEWALVARAQSNTRASIAEMAPRAPASLCAILERLIRADRTERYGSADELLDALAPLVPDPRSARGQLGALVRRVYAGDLDTLAEMPSLPLRSDAIQPERASAVATAPEPAAPKPPARPLRRTQALPSAGAPFPAKSLRRPS